jgi:hypothetical protein
MSLHATTIAHAGAMPLVRAYVACFPEHLHIPRHSFLSHCFISCRS